MTINNAYSMVLQWKEIYKKLRLNKESRNRSVEHISQIYEKRKACLVYIFVWQKKYTKLYYKKISHLGTNWKKSSHVLSLVI